MPLDEAVDISVVIATSNRAEMLRLTLDCLTRQAIGDHAWEVIVVDNGSTDHTPAVLEEMRARLPLVSLSLPVAQKTPALNRALDHARGRLLAFTDDDVTIPPGWLAEILRAGRIYPDASILCGPIVPVYPPGTPGWLPEHPFSGPAFARFTPDLAEGPLPPPWLPFGPNFAVRASHIDGLRFRTDLGPSAANPLTNDETAFMAEFRREGRLFVYLPAAGVVHHVRPHQLETGWLLERAFNMGRSRIVEEGRSLLPTVLERYARPCVDSNDVLDFEAAVGVNWCLGQLQQLRLTGDAPDEDARLCASLRACALPVVALAPSAAHAAGLDDIKQLLGAPPEAGRR